MLLLHIQECDNGWHLKEEWQDEAEVLEVVRHLVCSDFEDLVRYLADVYDIKKTETNKVVKLVKEIKDEPK
jgi:hypothetical protein